MLADAKAAPTFGSLSYRPDRVHRLCDCMFVWLFVFEIPICYTSILATSEFHSDELLTARRHVAKPRGVPEPVALGDLYL